MSFFIKKKPFNGVKRGQPDNRKAKKRKIEPKKSRNEEITSSEDEGMQEDENLNLSSSEDENETAQDKKVRLAKLFLEEIKREEKARLEREEIDERVISKRLKEDYLKETGKLRLKVADNYSEINVDNIRTLKCKQQRNGLTCICISNDNKFLFSGSLNGVVVKYSLSDCRRVGLLPFVRNSGDETIGHSSGIFSLAISTDSKYLSVGDQAGNINIWNPDTLKHIKTLTGHKKAILGLSFKKESHTLYSCSKDKSVKVWNLDEMAYVETLFGHQDSVSAVDSLHKDRVVTSGARDLRIWKIIEETQLIYNGHMGNIDHVRFINEEHFFSGGDDGQICVWSFMRKKPLQIIESAHGKDLFNNQPRWITAIAALVNTDLVASGSYDGYVRLWKLEDNFKKSKEILKIRVQGVINALSFASDGQSLVVAVSRDYKFGRWMTVKNAKDCILVVPFNVTVG
ncbi:U3 small nucleolar RNA-interacting protein 2-like [Dendroctonus ponderosae]